MGAGIGNIRRNNVKRRSYREERVETRRYSEEERAREMRGKIKRKRDEERGVEGETQQ